MDAKQNKIAVETVGRIQQLAVQLEALGYDTQATMKNMWEISREVHKKVADEAPRSLEVACCGPRRFIEPYEADAYAATGSTGGFKP